MNNVLNDVADTVRQEMDLITSLFDYIHLLPISEHEHTNLVEYECNKDEHEEEHEHEHDEDVKLLSNQIARLLKLEAKAKNTSDESITDKAKDVLAEAVVDALKTISSSPKLQELLENNSRNYNNMNVAVNEPNNNNNDNVNDNSNSYNGNSNKKTNTGNKGGGGGGEEEEDANNTTNKVEIATSTTIQKNIQKVRDVSCRELSITYNDDKKNESILFKLIDKCKQLESEIQTKQNILAHKTHKFNQEQEEYGVILKETLERKDVCEKEAFVEQEDYEFEAEHELKQKTNEQEDFMVRARQELVRVEQQQMEQLQSSTLEEQTLLQRLTDLEHMFETNKEQHEIQKRARQDAIHKTEANYKAETEERNYLQLRYALVQSNQKIADREKKILEDVARMEDRADAILFHSAVALQKIVRGARDRAIVRKLKKKKKKKGKKGGKKSGKGKGK